MAQGAFLSDGRKWLQCPYCHQILEVDIDDILPVHGRSAVIVSVDPMRIESRGEPCDGSWNVKGEPLKVEIAPSKKTDK